MFTHVVFRESNPSAASRGCGDARELVNQLEPIMVIVPPKPVIGLGRVT